MQSINPIAQTFNVQGTLASGLPGVFLTQIGVYFQSKSATQGVYCAVVETVNGVPNSSSRLGSCYMPVSKVTTSLDSSSETIFQFMYPLMLSADKTYAFMIQPEGSTPDYDVWVSDVGGTDIITKEAITQKPYVGTLYISSNGNSWTAIQSQDIKFNLYIAKFNSTQGTVVFRNTPTEYITLNLSLNGGIYLANSANPINHGDLVYAANATNLSSILTTNNTIYPYGTVKDIDPISGVLYIENTNGNFSNTAYKNLRFYRTPDPSNTAYINSTYLIGNATISTIDDLYYEAFVPKFTMTEPSGTYTKASYYGTSNNTNSSAKDTVPVTPINETIYEFHDSQRVIRSYSNEKKQGTYGTQGTSTYQLDLITSSPYQSPVIDLAAKNFNYIHNRINDAVDNFGNPIGENTRYGQALTKYISQTIILDTLSEDFKVWVTGYRPVGTDIIVYGKFLNSNDDSDLFDVKEWSRLSFLNNCNNIYSSPKDGSDYKEYSYGLIQSAARPTSTDVTNGLFDSTNVAYGDSVGDVDNNIAPGTLTYYGNSNVLHRGFTTFAIKIVLLSENNALYPNMRDVRGTALMM